MADTIKVESCFIKNYELSGWNEKISGRWDYHDLLKDENWRDGWISFDSLLWDDATKKLYCGLNSIDGDILYSFDPDTNKFTSLDTKSWADPFDVKIHRTILKNPYDGCFYFGTSLLHETDQQQDAPGGKIVKYDPVKNQYEVLGIAFPHLYVQSIAADFQRGYIYAFTYPAEFVVKFDLKTRKSEILAYISNSLMLAQPHNGVVDKHGALWGTYAETRAWEEKPGPMPIRIFKYDPETDKITWFRHRLPGKKDKNQLIEDPADLKEVAFVSDESRHKEDHGFCDSMLYDGDRYIYAGTVFGVLARIDIETGNVEKICHLMSAGRLPALTMDRAGNIYAAGGMKHHTHLFRWNPDSRELFNYGEIIDKRINEKPSRIHEIAIDDRGNIYLAENDNHHRSSYLWIVKEQGS